MVFHEISEAEETTDHVMLLLVSRAFILIHKTPVFILFSFLLSLSPPRSLFVFVVPCMFVFVPPCCPFFVFSVPSFCPSSSLFLSLFGVFSPLA